MRSVRTLTTGLVSVALLTCSLVACTPSRDAASTGCFAGLLPPTRVGEFVGAPGLTVDPDELPARDTYGIDGEAMATLKARVDAEAPAVAQIARQCVAFTGAEPDRQVLSAWLGRFSRGASLADLARVLGRSTGFRQLYGSFDDETFLRSAYVRTVRRAPDAGEETFGLALLRGGVSRSSILTLLAESPDSRRANNSAAYVLAIYHAITTASPTSGDLERFTSELIDVVLRVQVIEDIALSRAPAQRWVAAIQGGQRPSF